MDKYILYVGLNDKDTKTQKIDTLSAYNLTNNILLNYVEGATVTQSKGIYKHNNGNVVIENTLIIELLFTDKTTVETIAKELKIALNQESIAIQKQTIESYLF
jgi:hypothetical protein